MKISQIFGPTVQGEGTAAGRHCVFVRTYHCNLRCFWCDTAYTWADTPEKAAMTRSGFLHDRNNPRLGLKEMTVEEVLAHVHKLWNYTAQPTIIVFSGGEPMMQQADLAELAKSFRAWNNEVHVETAGTLPPTYEMNLVVTQYNVSPKLAHSNNRLDMRYRPAVLRILQGSGKAWFKFVVTQHTMYDDFKEIEKIADECQIPARRIQVMAEGTIPFDLTMQSRTIVDEALKRGYGLSMRQHAYLWPGDDEK